MCVCVFTFCVCIVVNGRFSHAVHESRDRTQIEPFLQMQENDELAWP